jgi:hypothetical protein
VGNNKDVTIEYDLNTISSIEDVINAFEHIVLQESN